MRYRPVKVIIYGMFPTYFIHVSDSAYEAVSGEAHAGLQAKEYPEWMIEQQRFALRLAERLSSYVWLVRIEMVSADSPRGLFLALKHKLGRGPAVIVEGKVFRDGEDLVERVERYIEFLLRSRFSGGGSKKK